jgi:subfamily B ATP-binding cassette protein MsbA
LVSQHVVLFNDTIANNIAYGSESKVSREQILAVAKTAHVLEFLEQLPQGLDTMVGENGFMLSGGQRQRLAIARALLLDAPILILDEATSALDTESERLIQDALDRLQQNRTSIVVAHRLSTIENADTILVIEAGEIIEQGTHQSLLSQNGAYSQLYNMQFSEELVAK